MRVKRALWGEAQGAAADIWFAQGRICSLHADSDGDFNAEDGYLLGNTGGSHSDLMILIYIHGVCKIFVRCLCVSVWLLLSLSGVQLVSCCCCWMGEDQDHTTGFSLVWGSVKQAWLVSTFGELVRQSGWLQNFRWLGLVFVVFDWFGGRACWRMVMAMPLKDRRLDLHRCKSGFC